MTTTNKRKSLSQKHDAMMAKWMADPAFKAEYEALEEEYQLLREMLEARKRAGLTQAEVAVLMGTKAPAVARLEALLGEKKHSPSISTLRKYAEAVGCKLEIHFKPFKRVIQKG